MGYPRGEVEHAIGTIEWQMLSPTEISVKCERAMIHNIVYQANVRVEKLISGERQHPQGTWRALFGNLYMRRLITNSEPTMKARELFKELAEQIAVEHDNEAVRHHCEIAALREKKKDAEKEIAKLKAKIFVLEGEIADADAALQEIEG